MNENPSFIEKFAHNFEIGIILVAAWIYGLFHRNETQGHDDWEH